MTAITLKFTAAPAVRRPSLRRVLAHRGGLVAVLSLLGSSAAYAVHTLLHLA